MRISDWSADVCSSDLDHRSAVERVEDDVRVVALGEGEAELRGPLGGRHFGGHIVIGEIDLVRIGPRFLGLVAEPARALVLADLERPRLGEQRKGRVIVHPRAGLVGLLDTVRSEEHTSELQSLMRISYAVFCLKKKIKLNK